MASPSRSRLGGSGFRPPSSCPTIAAPAKLQRIGDIGAQVVVGGATYAEALAGQRGARKRNRRVGRACL